MRNHWVLGILTLVAGMCLGNERALAQQAGRAETLNVVGTVPLPGDVLRDQIVVFFDKPIVLPPDSAGQPQAPFTLSNARCNRPQVGPNYIAVQLTAGDNAIVELALNPALQSTDGKPLNPNSQRMVFATFIFEVRRLWVLSKDAQQAVVGLDFPTPVKPDEMQSHLQVVHGDGQPYAFSVEGTADPTMVRLVLPGAFDPAAVITVKEGLKDATGKIVLSPSRPYKMPQLEPLKVVGAQLENLNDDEQTISVQFSKPVIREDLESHLTIKDVGTGQAVAFSIEEDPSIAAKETFNLTATVPDPTNVRLELSIAAGLKSQDGRVMEAPCRTTLQQGKPAGLAIESTWWNQDWAHNGKGGLLLEVRFNRSVKPAELKDKVEITPPLENMKVLPSGMAASISGDWNSNTRYEIKIAGLRHQVRTERVPVYAGFDPETEYYFPKRTGLALPLNTRNLDHVTLSLYRMFPSNIAVAVNDMADGHGSVSFNENWSERLLSKEIPIAKRTDRLVETPVQLDQVFPEDKKGVFCLTAGYEERAQGEYSPTATKLVLLTNIGLLAYWQKNELVLFAHDLFSLAPLDKAKVSVFSHKNQLMGTAETNSDGIARLGPFVEALGQPRVAVVEWPGSSRTESPDGKDPALEKPGHYDGDYSFLQLNAREEDNRAFTPDMPAYNRKGYDAFIYADRDLYRPGETIHAHWLTRTNYGDALPNVPLMATVLKPNGRSVLSQAVTLSDLGTGGIDIPTARIYPTGKYTIQLAVPGSKGNIGSYQFHLEDFVPNRIKTSVKLDDAVWRAGNTYTIRANAQHLFGAPAVDRKCEATVVFRRDAFSPEAWKTYRFGNDTEFVPEPVPCGEQTTDKDGNAQFTFSYQVPPKVTFPMRAFVVARTFELGGRSVAAKSEVMYFPSDICLGVSVAGAKDGGGIDVYAAAVTPGAQPGDAKPAALDKVKVSLQRQVWNYYVRRYYTHHEPKWAESFEEVETREVPLVEGKGATTFSPQPYGYYRVRVFSEATQQYSTVSFYNYGSGCQMIEEARPNLIKVTLNKDSYVLGEEAEIRVESPFDGKGIIVLQGEEIQEMIPVDIKDKVGVIKYTVTARQVPNVWVEATVIHAVKTDRKQVYPFSSFAMTNLKVRDPQRGLAVAFAGLPQEIKPATEAKFELDVRDAANNPIAAELTLAAVDEGIHAISDYQSPDPLKWLGRPRQPEFQRAHYYDKVAYDFNKPDIGGDALLKSVLKRVPGADENWIKPVALWSGTVKTDPAGHATVTMAVPEFSGQLRLVAVACTPSAVGAKSEDIYVRHPYILRTSMPRFLLPGDAIQSRATLFNNSDAPCKALLSWTAGGTVQQTAGSQALDLAPHAEATATANFTSGALIGQGELAWDAVITDANKQPLEHLVEKDPIPVRPPGAYQSQADMAVLKPGETREFRNANFIENEQLETEIAVGATPLLRLQKALKYVAGYPYGCVEQTTSKLMPMFVLREASALVTSALDEKIPIDSYIQSGISRLFSMQTSGGGLGMWPGAGTPYPYGSVYALHFLTLAKRSGKFDVPQPNFDALQRYVRGLALDWTNDAEPAKFRRAYALYVLALDGDLDAIQQIQRFDAVKMPRHARFLLAAALAQNTKDLDRVKAYLATSPAEPYTIKERSGTLNSDIRNTAIELLALRQIGAPQEQVIERVNALVHFLETNGYGTTQENSFIITSLASYFSDLAAHVDSAAGTITAAGIQSPPTPAEEKIVGPSVYRGTRKGPRAVFTVSNTGGTDLYVNLTTRGIPQKADTAAVAEGGLTIKRTFFTRTGVEYAGPAYAQGDSYVVDVEIGSANALENLIVADLLPAGFEIENPRLDPDSLPGGKFQGAATASNIDIRDDRLLLAFEALKSGTHHFYYIVRAVTAGSYQYPSISAECMYDASIRARSAMGEITVK